MGFRVGLGVEGFGFTGEGLGLTAGLRFRAFGVYDLGQLSKLGLRLRV